MYQKYICPPWCKIQVYLLCRSKSKQGIKIYKVDNTLSTKEWFYLDLWTCDLEINRDHLLIEGNPCTKFGIDQVKGSKDRPTYRPTDRHTDRQLQNNMPPFSRGHKNTTEKKPLDFTSNNRECYNEPFSLDKLSESLPSTRTTLNPILKIPSKIEQGISSSNF